MFSMDFLVKEFLFDCKVRSLSEQTILNYKKQLGHFVRFLETNCQVTNMLAHIHTSLNIFAHTRRKREDVFTPSLHPYTSPIHFWHIPAYSVFREIVISYFFWCNAALVCVGYEILIEQKPSFAL